MAAVCAISGQPPEEPVVSVKSGYVFEKRLIFKHLKTSGGKCPVTQEDLRPEDLIPLRVNPAVRARPPSATSIPGILSMLQNEWDASMLETHALKQRLETVQQDLAHTLYKYDAACRVIARLVKERDEARRTLSATTQNIAAAVKGAGGAMDVDEGGLDGATLAAMSSAAQDLSANRKNFVKGKQAKVASREAIAKYGAKHSFNLHSTSQPGISALDLSHADHDLALTGGNDGTAIVFNTKAGKMVDQLKGHKKKVTDVKFHPSQPIAFTSSADGTACIWTKSEGAKFSAQHTLSAHKGDVVGLTLHPTGDFLVTAGADRTWVFYDVATGQTKRTVQDEKLDGGYTRVQFHPDGLILGAGAADSTVRIFDVKQPKNESVAVFKGHTGAVSGLSFSENGYFLSSADDQGVVKLWDLRKLQNFHTINSEGAAVRSVEFDASGTYLAVAGGGVRVFLTKGWESVVSLTDHTDAVTAAKFGDDARFIASVSLDRTLKISA